MSAPRVPINSRMTANPARPARYRAGKKLEESSEEEDDDEEADEQDSEPEPVQKQAPPKASSFPKNINVNRKKVDKAQQRLDQIAEEARKHEEFKERERMEQDAGFVTESEDSEEEDGPAPKAGSAEQLPQPLASAGSESEEEEEEEEEEESSEEDETSAESSEDEQPKLLRPVFTKQNQRIHPVHADTLFATSTDVADTARRKANTDALLQDIGDARAAEKVARNKDWDDDEAGAMDEEAIDDRDDLDPELEHQQWVARELARLKRDRATMEAREAEIAEVERRRNLSTPEREAEDRETLEKQREERENKGQMSYMQKYQHRGAFYQDEGEASGLAKRDLMGARYIDQTQDKEALPEYLRRRDEKKIGKKGASKYKDMRAEDTGQFGGWVGGDRRGEGRGKERTGANASALGEKRRGGDSIDERPSKKQSVLARY